ncbi:MAG: hypothetical protein NT005_14355 [Spirochaetes bacterium]|nr:hypothetical protein [Spirochaetota bacterium]
MELVLSSDLCSLSFDSDTGALMGICDLERKAGFSGPRARLLLPFRLPGLDAPRLTDARLIRSLRGERIRLAFETDGIIVLLSVSIGFRSAQSSWSLEVRNFSTAPRSILVEFPRIEGTGSPLFRGGPGWPAQWIAVADPSGRAGLGLVVRDRKAEPKTFTTEAGSVCVRYDSPFSVLPGRGIRLPETTVLVTGPDWRSTARVHAAWHRGSPPRGFPSASLSPETLLPLRMSFPALSLKVDNPVDASLAGIACRSPEEGGESSPLARNWTCASASAWQALSTGEICDDPRSDDPGIITRMFHGADLDAIVAVRPEQTGGETQDRGPGSAPGSRLADFHAPYEIRLPVKGDEIPEVAVCDLEDLSWRRLIPIVRDGCFSVDSSSNWLLCLVLGRKRTLVGFDPPVKTAPGDAAVIRINVIAGTGRTKRVLFAAPGLLSPASVAIGGEVSVPVPLGTPPGLSPLTLCGKNVPRFTRLLQVLG